MKFSLKLLLVITLIFAAINPTHAQTKKEKQAALADVVKQVVTSMKYFFAPVYANSSGGSFPVLSTYYLKVSKDSIQVYLPYFGNSHTSGGDAGDGTINFTWTTFNFDATQDKKSNWKIIITPKNLKMANMKDARSLTLLVSADGSATLQVISFNREPISFDGSIGNMD